MKSSSGQHWLALDHIRALAAFMVFTWHFAHGRDGWPIPDASVPTLPLAAFLDEGQTGVALFMTLSGYLFAKLLDGKTIHYGKFFWNRILRLAPLLLTVMAYVGLKKVMAGESLSAYLFELSKGFVLPTWPSGGWSIAIELQFYLLLPILIPLLAKKTHAALMLVACAIVLRCVLYMTLGEVHWLAYTTIIGRVDQFVIGMWAFHVSGIMAGRHRRAFIVGALFTAYYWAFDYAGGSMLLGGRYPSPSPLWIIMPTLEGLGYGLLIAWYEGSFAPKNKGVSKWIGLAGTYSYSIYILHFFVVFRMAPMIDAHIMKIDGFTKAYIWSLVGFIAMMPIGYLSFRLIEKPALKFRTPYLVNNSAARSE